MSFTADKQTLEDLNILAKYKSNSVFNLFNKVTTSGGEKLLESMFNEPLTNEENIKDRIAVFKYFQSNELSFPIDNQNFVLMEHYLYNNSTMSRGITAINILKLKFLDLLVKDEEYARITSGIQATIKVLIALKDFVKKLNKVDKTHPYFDQYTILNALFQNAKLASLAEFDLSTMGLQKTIQFENLFRNHLKLELDTLVDSIHRLDVYITVGNIARLKSLDYALPVAASQNLFEAKDLRHPVLDSAVGNDVCFHQKSNLIFLTGANMAGKSTFMKTIGISLYLAHMGFPLAGSEMKFSIKEGIYSSINVPDNLNMGLSHFYAEVLRVKTVAEEVASGKNLVVIFDELFKGTNVKDAYDATLAVSEAFSEYSNCLFVISTHITEVGEALKRLKNISFLFLPTIVEKNVPKYTFKLQQGITLDQQGMMIIENEGILEMLKPLDTVKT